AHGARLAALAGAKLAGPEERTGGAVFAGEDVQISGGDLPGQGAADVAANIDVVRGVHSEKVGIARFDGAELACPQLRAVSVIVAHKGIDGAGDGLAGQGAAD